MEEMVMMVMMIDKMIGIITGHLEIFLSLREKGEQPFSHLMEFEDYLVASGVTVDEDENDPRQRPYYRDIINTFKASLKNNARVWHSMCIENRVQDLHSAEGWKTVKSQFLTYFNPIGSTKEKQIKHGKS